MNNNIKYSNNFSSVDCNYIQSLILGLNKEMIDILSIVNLSKNDNDKIKYFSEVDLLNQKIINYFKIIEEAVLSNLNFLNNILFKNNIIMEDNKEYIEIKPKIIRLIIDNKKYLSLLNCLKINYLNIEDIFIKNLFK